MPSPFDRLARYQIKHPEAIVVAGLVLTAVLMAGIPKIELQTDFQDSLPDDIPAIQAQEKVESNFGSQNAIIVLFQVDDSKLEESFVTDVRDPRLIESMRFLESELADEPLVGSVNSMASLFPTQPASKQEVIPRLEASSASFTNRDFTATTMFVEISEESTEETIREATQILEDNIDQTPTYPGIDIRITGTPVIRTTLADIMVTDSARTIAIAAILILSLLALARGIVYGPITFIPLLAGVFWTLGTMGHVGIPLSFATITLGSMILGLGVEYGSFITERILEELDEQDLDGAIATAVPNTGRAILGSATTDGIGFLALLLASISFVRDLGLTLALGEFLTVGSALIITPAFIVMYRRRWAS